MKAICLLVALFFVAVADASVEALSWWTPPTSLTREDRLGYSEASIIAMGLDRWGEIVYKKTQDHTLDSLADGPDGANIVFGVCLANRNNRLIAKLPARERSRYRQLRSDLFLFAMSCIVMEDTLAGGGTYSVHWPRYISRSQEDLIYAMLLKQSPTKIKTAGEAKFKALLKRYRTVTGKHPTVLFGTADNARLHKFAKLSTDYYGRVLADIQRLAPNQKTRGLGYIQKWLVDYLNIRGAADGIAPRKS